MSQRGVVKPKSMDDWLRSPTPGKGGGGKFLSKWKDFKKGTGQVDTWMHTKQLPLSVLRHQFPMLIAVEDKQAKTKVVHVWNRPHTCHETGDVFDKLYWRKEKGVAWSERTKAPERCGMCKFAEWLWLQSWAWINSHSWDDKEKVWVENEEGGGEGVNPCAVLFKFISEADDDENRTIHVGGYCGLFGRKDPPEDLLKAMAASKIRASEAWGESCMVKAKSVICVVDNDDIAAGVQISEETKELGEKVKEEITRVLKSTKTDIQRTPYCIQWEYDKAKQMGKQYAATAMMTIPATPRVLALIRGPQPDLTEIETPMNQQAMRSLHERHCKLPKGSVPWDEIFPSKEQEAEWNAEGPDADPEDLPEGGEDEETETETDEDAGATSETEDDDAPEEDEDDEVVACDECGKPTKLSDTKCPHCGKQFEVEEEEPEPVPEPPKKLRTRAEAAAEKKTPPKAKTEAPAPTPKATAPAAKPGPKKAAAKPKPEPVEESTEDDPDAEGGDDGNQGAKLPF